MPVQNQSIETFHKYTASGELSESRGKVLRVLLVDGEAKSGREIAVDYCKMYDSDLFNISRGIYGRLGELVEMGLVETCQIKTSNTTGMPELQYKAVDPLPEHVRPLQKKKTKGMLIKELALSLNWAVASVQKKIDKGVELPSVHKAWFQNSKQLLNEVYNVQNKAK